MGQPRAIALFGCHFARVAAFTRQGVIHGKEKVYGSIP
jgi:hypothetical protein